MASISTKAFTKLLGNASDIIKLIRGKSDLELKTYYDVIRQIRGRLRAVKPGVDNREVFGEIAHILNEFVHEKAPPQTSYEMKGVVAEHIHSGGDLQTPPLSRAIDEVAKVKAARNTDPQLIRFLTSLTFIGAIAEGLGRDRITLAQRGAGRGEE